MIKIGLLGAISVLIVNKITHGLTWNWNCQIDRIMNHRNFVSCLNASDENKQLIKREILGIGNEIINLSSNLQLKWSVKWEKITYHIPHVQMRLISKLYTKFHVKAIATSRRFYLTKVDLFGKTCVVYVNTVCYVHCLD